MHCVVTSANVSFTCCGSVSHTSTQSPRLLGGGHSCGMLCDNSDVFAIDLCVCPTHICRCIVNGSDLGHFERQHARIC